MFVLAWFDCNKKMKTICKNCRLPQGKNVFTMSQRTKRFGDVEEDAKGGVTALHFTVNEFLYIIESYLSELKLTSVCKEPRLIYVSRNFDF